MAKKVKPVYTENWLPVKGIQNGMIYAGANQKITGVKITPKNIFILDQNTQENILISLKNFYNTIDYEFWLVVADRPVDISVYQAELQLLYNDAPNAAIRKLIMQDIRKANTFIKNNVVDTEYYLLFIDASVEILEKRIRMMISGLANCGLNASKVSNGDLRVVLENFLNGGNNTEFGMVMPI